MKISKLAELDIQSSLTELRVKHHLGALVAVALNDTYDEAVSMASVSQMADNPGEGARIANDILDNCPRFPTDGQALANVLKQ